MVTQHMFLHGVVRVTAEPVTLQETERSKTWVRGMVVTFADGMTLRLTLFPEDPTAPQTLDIRDAIHPQVAL